MGNCQAAEAATVVIQHPGNKIERIYWSVSAHQVMSSNPGHYVALVVTSPTAKSESGAPLKHLKLLRPDDTLLIGQVYRLISFEDVLKEFVAKKSVKLGKLLKDSRGIGTEKKKSSGAPNPNSKAGNHGSAAETEQEIDNFQLGSTTGTGIGGGGGGIHRGVGRHYGGGGLWKPALQSIAEVGT